MDSLEGHHVEDYAALKDLSVEANSLKLRSPTCASKKAISYNAMY